MRDRLRGAPRESLFCFTNISGLLRVASASKKKDAYSLVMMNSACVKDSSFRLPIAFSN